MAGVYISYPFCAQKCTFCNFASGVESKSSQARYSHLLLNELRGHQWQFVPETVYFGGGTPSLMSPELLHALTAAIPQDHLTEVTLECAPGTITRERIAHWKACGINRVSFGVQSFVTGELRAVGRRHTAETVQGDLAMLRDEGITNVNLDLIAGLPRQTADSWGLSLDWIERLAAPHASIYLFEIDEDSRLGKEVLQGGRRYRADRLPAEDLGAELYEVAVERLRGMGLPRYEISNFAREGCESRHNLKYWQLEPYVGFGLDAHSFDGRYRWGNPDTLSAYFAARELPGGGGCHHMETDPAEERFFVGLRLARGIRPNVEDWTRFAAPIERWLSAGMLERTAEDRLRLSERAYVVSNEIFQEFINA